MTDVGTRESRWRRCKASDCVWIDCDDGFVLYHRPSGKTHLMNDASVALLTEVLAEPKALVEIEEAFHDEFPERAAQEFIGRMASLIHRLEQLGLVERV